MTGIRIPAVYMRAGLRKGVFLLARDLPSEPRRRDGLLARLVGSPDPQGLQRDGIGNGIGDGSDGDTLVAVISPSRRDDSDADCLFGRVALADGQIDWSGTGEDLLAAAGPYAIHQGLVPPTEGHTRVRLWLPGPGVRVDAFVPVRDAQVAEDGAFAEDGLPFPGAEIRLEHLRPDGALPGAPQADTAAMRWLPTGAVQERLKVPGVGELAATMVALGDPTVFVRADALGLTGREMPDELARQRKVMERLGSIRAHAAVRMGLADTVAHAINHRPGVPQLSWVARPAAYRTLSGDEVSPDRIDLLVRTLAAGRVQSACSEGASVALAVAAALPGTVVHEVARTLPGVPTRIGHVSGTLAVGADVSATGDGWQVDKVTLSRTARRLMSGWVHLP